MIAFQELRSRVSRGILRSRLERLVKWDDKIFLIIIAVVLIFSVIQQIFSLPTYYSRFLSNMLIFAIFGFAYNLLHGHTGLISFGHAGFYIVGAYAGAMTMQYASDNVWIGFLGSMAISAAFAFIVGFASVRIRGIYFALLTLSFSMIPFLLIRGPLSKLTGGEMGWHLAGRSPQFLFDISNAPLFLFFVVVVSVLVYVIFRLIVNSKFGQCLKCIKDNELKLQGLGYHTMRLKCTAVTISGLLSGFAGYMYLLNNQSISPALGTYFMSAKVIFIVLIGGISTIVGPLVGSLVWSLIDEFVVIPGFTEITLGVALMIVIFRFPKGMTGLLSK